MGAFSNYAEQKLLGVTLLGSSFTAVPTVWISLATSIGDDGGSYAEVPGGTGYARQIVVFGAPVDTSPSYTCRNTAQITFPDATTPWGGIVACAYHDAAAAGNMLYAGTITSVQTVDTGGSLKISVNSLSVSLD
jgi:hypothetical protein